MKLNFWAKTDVGRVRGHNEDNFLVDKKLNLFVVCDGMGGHAAGEVASAVCVRTVRQYLAQHTAVFESMKSDPGNPDSREAVISVVQQSVENACATVWHMAQADASKKGMGTTCSLLLVIGNIGFVGHVGDSRLYLSRANKIVQITTDHSFVNEMLRLGKIKPGEEDTIPHKNAVTRAVGVNETVEVDAFEFEFIDGDSVLLCSDGLSGYLESDEQTLHLLTDRSPKDITEVAINHANNAGGKDNITAISIQFGEKGFSKTNGKQLIKNNELFRYLSPKELSLVFGICTFETFSKDLIVFEEGDDPARICIIMEGEVRLYAANKTLRTIGVGGAFAEFSVLNAHQTRYAVQANKDLRILTIARETFMELMKSEPGLSVKILWNFVQRYSEMSALLHPRDLIFSQVGLSNLDSSGSLAMDSEAMADPTLQDGIDAVELDNAMKRQRSMSEAGVILKKAKTPGIPTLPARQTKPIPAIPEEAMVNSRAKSGNSRAISGKSIVKPAPKMAAADRTEEIDISDENYEEIE